VTDKQLEAHQFKEYMEELETRREEVEIEAMADPALARFFLILDALFLRGIDRQQAARTASIIHTGQIGLDASLKRIADGNYDAASRGD